MDGKEIVALSEKREKMQKSYQEDNKILSEQTGQPLDIIKKDTERDNFMSAEEALKYGLIDKIVEKR